MSGAEKRLWITAGVAGCFLLLYLLGPILTPFLISAMLAWLGDPVADRLEAWKFPRGFAVVTVFLGTFIVLGLLLLLIVPMVVREFAALTVKAPQALTWYQDVAVPWLSVHLGVDPARLRIEDLPSLVTGNFDNAGQLMDRALTTFSHSGHTLFVFFINLLLVPVVTFYWLRDWDIFKARVAELLPRDQAGEIAQIARECDAVLSAFFRGQLLVMASLALIYSFALTLIGLENAVGIGVIAGLLSFVPYLGIGIGISLALLSAVLQGAGLWLPVEVLIAFAVGHGLESFVLTPRFVGGRIGLHPVLVIFAILAGGKLFGFVGVLLALPVAAAGTVFVRHAHARYMQSGLYRGHGDGGPT